MWMIVNVCCFGSGKRRAYLSRTRQILCRCGTILLCSGCGFHLQNGLPQIKSAMAAMVCSQCTAPMALWIAKIISWGKTRDQKVEREGSDPGRFDRFEPLGSAFRPFGLAFRILSSSKHDELGGRSLQSGCGMTWSGTLNSPDLQPLAATCRVSTHDMFIELLQA